MGCCNDEREQTLKLLLVKMDSFEANNAHKPAFRFYPTLQYPGRFDLQVMASLDKVDSEMVEKIFVEFTEKVYSGGELVGNFESTECTLMKLLDGEIYFITGLTPLWHSGR